jgi:hypothetical protein
MCIYLRSRANYVAECWKQAKRSKLAAIMGAAVIIYSMVQKIVPFFDLSTLHVHLRLPRLPISLALYIALVAALWVAIEGGYRTAALEKQESARTRLQVEEFARRENTLVFRARRLARELMQFLKECGPRPEVRDPDSLSDAEILEVGSEDHRVERIHFGYSMKFKDRVSSVVDEFGSQGLQNVELNSTIGRNTPTDTGIRTIVEQLLLLALKLETREISGS